MKVSKQAIVKGSGFGGKSLYVRVSDLCKIVGAKEGDLVEVTIEYTSPTVEDLREAAKASEVTE